MLRDLPTGRLEDRLSYIMIGDLRDAMNPEPTLKTLNMLSVPCRYTVPMVWPWPRDTRSQH